MRHVSLAVNLYSFYCKYRLPCFVEICWSKAFRRTKTDPTSLSYSCYCELGILIPMFLPMVQQPLVYHDLLIIEAKWSHLETPHSVGLLWACFQPDVQTSTWQHTTLTKDRYPCPRRDSNPQSQQANDRRPTPWTARPLGSAINSYTRLKIRFFSYKGWIRGTGTEATFFAP